MHPLFGYRLGLTFNSKYIKSCAIIIDMYIFELFLLLNAIEHTWIRVRRPQTSGSVERLNQIIKDEFYEVAFRKKLYLALEEIRADLDEFMKNYNEERTNQGKYC